MTKQHIPKIRFQGFNDEWEKVNLSEIAPIRSGYSFKSKLFKDSGIPIVRISNILSDGTVRGEFVFYDEIPNDNKYLLQGKSILIAMSGATTGKVALLNSSEKYYQNQRVGYFKEKVDISFVYSILSTGNFVNQLSDVLVAGAQPNISAKDINNFNFLIPNTLPEQESIGQLFRTLDDLISAYKDNLEHYQSLKTSMLSKMFPKEGQKQPEIRLDGFEGDWEEKKLSELTEEIEYGLNVSSKSFDGVNKYLRITDIDDKYRNFIEDNLTSPDVDLTSLDSYLLKVGDILFARTGASVGKSYRYKISDGKVYFAGFLIRARIKKEYDVEFVYQNTLTARYYQYIKITSQRSGQPGVNGKEYGSFKIPLPSLSEQEAIGAFFANLDETISSYQDKIGQLELLKKRLLHNLFI